MPEVEIFASAERLHALSLNISVKLDWAVGYIVCSLERLHDPNLPTDEMLNAVEEGLDSIIIELENAFTELVEFDRLFGHGVSFNDLARYLGESKIEQILEVYRDAALRAKRLCYSDQSVGPPVTAAAGFESFWRYKVVPLVREVRSFLIRGYLPEDIESKITELRSCSDELELENKRFKLIAQCILDGYCQFDPSEADPPGIEIGPNCGPMRPSSWFDRATNGALNADRLRMATKGSAPRLLAGKSGRLNTYSVLQVTRAWPEFELMLTAALKRDQG